MPKEVWGGKRRNQAVFKNRKNNVHGTPGYLKQKGKIPGHHLPLRIPRAAIERAENCTAFQLWATVWLNNSINIRDKCNQLDERSQLIIS